MFTSIMQIAFPETDKVVYKSHEGALASVKSTLLQIKIPSFPPEIGSSGLKQMSRGPRESIRDGKSPGRNKADVCHKRKLKILRVLPAGTKLQKQFLEEFIIIPKCANSRKRKEKATPSPETNTMRNPPENSEPVCMA